MTKIISIIIFLIVCTINAQTKTTYTYAIKDGDSLKLDVYTPKNVKPTDTLPSLLWMHGGGFAGGTRDNPAEQKLAEYAAQNGYIGISLSYRLMRKGKPSGFGCECPKEEKLNTFKAAVEDYMDATLFVINNKDKLNINPNKIIAGGSSAGAEGILNAVFMREHFIDNLDKYRSIKFAGVFSLAGAMINADYITKENAIPTVLFHGTDDNLVPYATAPHHYCDSDKPGYLILDGSATIVEKLNELEESYYFYSVKGGKHEMSGVPFYDLDNVFEFFNQTILSNKVVQTKKIIKK
ncbi:carboxylesterase family protein [Aureibaculum sp. 2210JD6-5]|uniref:alpha/beta hydrolase n=1 Tax=Aureibaculum sp. 2210JD6-5 TaxID=3103957 RepID=UPI002AAD8615|nr:carboxylesterase family protein [Aureibaculum sp. 2210JD6-5]MDY7394324.1 carboxylesterase family protein [Aureibaculum sp. 2210JD6-5]